MGKSNEKQYGEEFWQETVKLVLENKVRQFHKEKADLEDTIDILKKAAAFFAQHQKSIP